MSESDALTQDELAQARRLLEVMHGDHLRTAFTDPDNMESQIDQAEGIRQALGVVTKLENGDWNTDEADAALNAIGEGDTVDVDADELRELSQYAREHSGLVSQHPVIKRVQTRTARGYWTLLKDLLGVSNRA